MTANVYLLDRNVTIRSSVVTGVMSRVVLHLHHQVGLNVLKLDIHKKRKYKSLTLVFGREGGKSTS